MRWLITGGCGFIGTNLIQTLAREGNHSIRVVDNLSVGTRDALASITAFSETSDTRLVDIDPGTVQLVVGDVIDADLAVRTSKGMDISVHLAANTGVAPSVSDPRADCITNVIGTFNYLEAARIAAVKRFVFASSGAPVGECTPPIHEEVAPHPVSPYGASKLAGEGYCSAYYRSFGIETVALRFGNVYGPRSFHKSSVVAKFIRQALNGETLEIYGDGSQTRDFIYIQDLARAIYLAATTAHVGGEIFQIASAQETSVGEILKELQSIFNKNGISNIDVRYGSWRAGDVRRNFSDTSKAKALLGWKPDFDLHSGLEKTFHWFRSLTPVP